MMLNRTLTLIMTGTIGLGLALSSTAYADHHAERDKQEEQTEKAKGDMAEGGTKTEEKTDAEKKE